MIPTLKLHLGKGEGKKQVHEKIALFVNKQFQRKQLRGEIGEENPISKGTIQAWIEEFCMKQKYLCSADRLRHDYWIFLERLYTRIMNGYIRKDELTTDTDESYNSNVYYYPGLVYIMGIGYIITNSESLIQRYESDRTTCLDAQKKHLFQKCADASDFVKMLPPKQQEKLTGYE